MQNIKVDNSLLVRASAQPFQRLLSVSETADHLGISKSWLQKSRVYGTGPTATVIGRRILYDLRDVEAWLATQKQRDVAGPKEAAAKMPELKKNRRKADTFDPPVLQWRVA